MLINNLISNKRSIKLYQKSCLKKQGFQLINEKLGRQTLFRE